MTDSNFPKLPDGFTVRRLSGDLRYGQLLWDIMEQSSLPHEVVVAMRVADEMLKGELITPICYDVLKDKAREKLDAQKQEEATNQQELS